MSFGATEFASNNLELSELCCVLKRLFSDFIVIEIPANGRALCASGTDKEVQRCDDDEREHVINYHIDHGNPENTDTIETPERLSEEDFDRLKKVAVGELEQCCIDLKDWPKEVRKALHAFIHKTFGHSNIRSGCENGILTVRKKKEGEPEEGERGVKRGHWPRERGDFLHFTLVKENLDTHVALALLAKQARLKTSLFSVSGTKDRRAITVQRVCAYRVEKHRLANLKLRGIWLSQFNYSPEKLKLGDASGNRFSIILRDIEPSAVADKSQLCTRIDNWIETGFLNYFGPQRFGSCGVETADIGRLILGGKWEQAVSTLLAPRRAMEKLNKSLQLFAENGDASAALNLLPCGASTSIERALLTSLSKAPKAQKGAILALPRDVRTMYIHAYQSLVFNKIVSRRRREYGLAVLEGDLDRQGQPLDVSRATIDQVCLPLPSVADTQLPHNEVGKWYEQIAREDGIDGEQFEKLERQFSIGSVYRPFIEKPKDVNWELLEYNDKNEVLQHCEFLPGGKEKGETGRQQLESRALRIQFNLAPGTYATIALRELTRTDLGKKAQKALEEKLAGKQESQGE